MRIHVTYTGGTIGMIETPHGLAPGADMRGWLDHVLEGTQVTREQVTFTELSPLIDSSNATPENWQAIIDDLWANRDDADAFMAQLCDEITQANERVAEKERQIDELRAAMKEQGIEVEFEEVTADDTPEE